jgi:hypothetical protein
LQTPSPGGASSRLAGCWQHERCGLLTSLRWAEPQQEHGCAEPEQQQRCLVGCEPESALAPPQPHENPDTGWTAIAAANNQESIFGNPIDEYISVVLLLTSIAIVSPVIGLGKT